MNTQYQQLFSKIPVHEPSERIFVMVIERIEQSQIRRSRLHALLHGTVALGAVVVAIPAFEYLASSLARSGFYQYASLAFSDSSVALAHWKDIALSVADSLPILASILFVSVILILANSLRGLVRYRSALFEHRRHASMLGIAA